MFFKRKKEEEIVQPEVEVQVINECQTVREIRELKAERILLRKELKDRENRLDVFKKLEKLVIDYDGHPFYGNKLTSLIALEYILHLGGTEKVTIALEDALNNVKEYDLNKKRISITEKRIREIGELIKEKNEYLGI